MNATGIRPAMQLMVLALAFVAVAVPAAAVDHIHTRAERAWATTQSAKVPADILSDSLTFAAVHIVPAPDVDKLRQEDATAGAPKPARIGVFQPVMPPVETVDEAWQTRHSGGLAQAVLIEAPGARGLRLEIEVASLPKDAHIYLYNAEDPREAYGPLSIDGPTPYWSPTCFAERAVLVCTLPANAKPAAFRLRASRVAWIYRDLAEMVKTGKNAGSCNLDAACYSDWTDTAGGVAGIGTIGILGALFCTGALITDLDPCTQTPFFLTANHCITRDSSAHAAEFYWFYGTNGCNGTPADPATVPRTLGGADRLAYDGGRADTGGGNDFCLMRMRNAPPSGATYLGWSTGPVVIGTPLTCIHHPRGDFKRISFGALTNNPGLTPAYYHEVTWQQGTTEPGSSGSPLLRADTWQIIGQLWGGGASCDEPLEPDYYGRFDVTYPAIEGFLSEPLTCGFSAAEFNTLENQGTATITVALNKPAGPGAVTLDYAVTAGSASPDDFTPASGTLVFTENEDTLTFAVTLRDDTHTEATETVILTLSAPSCGAIDGALGEAVLRIMDDDLDTDGDGISDVDESTGFYGVVTDPLRADSDGDGMTDAEELLGVFGFITDPTLRDSDGDGTNDYNEILFGLDPIDAQDAQKLPALVVPWYGEHREH